MKGKQIICCLLCGLLCLSCLGGIPVRAQTAGEDSAETGEAAGNDGGETGTTEEKTTEEKTTEEGTTEGETTEEENTEDDDMITISAYEGRVIIITKTIRIKKGSSIKLWVPELDKETVGKNMVFAFWSADPDGEEVITDDTVFYEDTSIYAIWEYVEPPLPPQPTHPDPLPSLPVPRPYPRELQDCEKMQKERMRLWKVRNVRGRKAKIKVTMGYNIKTYQIQYAGNKAFRQARTKTINVKRAKFERVLTLTKLKSGKTYYIRVRGIKKYNGKTYRSKWSGIKKVKISK